MVKVLAIDGGGCPAVGGVTHSTPLPSLRFLRMSFLRMSFLRMSFLRMSFLRVRFLRCAQDKQDKQDEQGLRGSANAVRGPLDFWGGSGSI